MFFAHPKLNREPKYWIIVNQRPVIKSKAKAGTSSVLQSPNQDLKYMGVLCTLKIKIESQNLNHGYIKDQWPYPNQDQDAKPQSGTSSVLQSPKWGLKGHGCSLQLQNQYREPKFGPWVCQRPETISKSRLRCQNQVRDLQCPPKPKSGLKSLHLQNRFRQPKFRTLVYQRPLTHAFGILKDFKLFWENQIWVKLKFDSWASLSQSKLG